MVGIRSILSSDDFIRYTLLIYLFVKFFEKIMKINFCCKLLQRCNCKICVVAKYIFGKSSEKHSSMQKKKQKTLYDLPATQYFSMNIYATSASDSKTSKMLYKSMVLFPNFYGNILSTYLPFVPFL